VIINTTFAQTNNPPSSTPAQSADEESTLPEVTVVAKKNMASVAAINAPVGPNEYILKPSDWSDVLTGSNAMTMLKNTPGVSYVATDSYGLDESDASLFMRGFHMNELAVLFEGIPMNDTSPFSLTGTTVLNIGVPDDIGSVTVSPGTARESSFSSSDDGGEILYSLKPLTDTPSVKISQSYGSDDTLVTTLSSQTGQWFDGGPKALLGFQRISDDKYQAGGTQYFLRGDLKVEQDVPWGDFTLFLSGSHAEIWGYDDLSFDMIKREGIGADYMYPNYRQAYLDALPQNANASCGVYTCGELAFLDPYDSGQNTTDLVGSVAHDFRISEGLSGTVRLYGAGNTTATPVSDPTTPSLTGAPFSEQVWNPQVTRFGGMLNLQYKVGPHTLGAGFWTEHDDSSESESWYNEPRLGQGPPLLVIGPYDVYGPAFQVENAARWRTESRQAYLQDDYAITDRLTVSAGFKAVDFVTSGGGIDGSQAPVGTLRARNGFLPHLSAMWRPDSQTDVFVDFGETETGYRVSPPGAIGYSASPWTASDQETFDVEAQSIHPEKDANLTIGAAHRFDAVSVSLDGYYSSIDNRLISASVGTLHAPVNTNGDVPHSHIVGTDLGATINFLRYFSFYQSAAYSRFTYDDNLMVEGTVYPIEGKVQPDYPMVSVLSDLSFRHRPLTAGITSTLYLRQPFSYENDIWAPNYWAVNGYLVYDLDRRGARPDLTFRLDIDNLLNRQQISNLAVDGIPFSGDLQTMQRSAPRQLLFTVSASY